MLTDFGCSVHRQDAAVNSQIATVGTRPYMAPELVDGHPDRLDFPLDIWSLGITILELNLKVSEGYLSQNGWAEPTNRTLIQSGAFLDNIVDSNLRDLLRKVSFAVLRVA